eukprot:g38293.t1
MFADDCIMFSTIRISSDTEAIYVQALHLVISRYVLAVGQRLEDVGECIEKIRIGHDGRGINSGWHLDRVEIRRLLQKGKGSATIIFPCERWLAKSEDDGEIIRELVPLEIIQKKLLKDGTLKHSESTVDDALE